jgi:hypothetical protein
MLARMKFPLPSLRHVSAGAAALALLGSAPALAQLDHDGALWEALFVQADLGKLDAELEGFRGWLDLHGRWRDDGEDLDTTIFRPGIGYTFAEKTTAWLGYAWVETHPAGRGSRTEHRLWQQLTWTPPSDGYTLSFRSRLEERFVEDADDMGWRFRQFAKYTRPMESKARYLSAWDEVFFDLNDTDFGQDFGLRQNRAFLGIGFFLDSEHSLAFEVGYLNQWLSRPGDDRMYHALSLNLLLTF